MNKSKCYRDVARAREQFAQADGPRAAAQLSRYVAAIIQQDKKIKIGNQNGRRSV